MEVGWTSCDDPSSRAYKSGEEEAVKVVEDVVPEVHSPSSDEEGDSVHNGSLADAEAKVC